MSKSDHMTPKVESNFRLSRLISSIYLEDELVSCKESSPPSFDPC